MIEYVNARGWKIRIEPELLRMGGPRLIEYIQSEVDTANACMEFDALTEGAKYE